MNFRTLIALTLRYHESEIADNVTNDFVLFKLLGEPDIAKKLFKMRKLNAGDSYAEGLRLTDDPGRKIVRKIRKGKNGTVRAYSRFDLLNIDPQDNFDEVEFDWRSVAGAVHLSGEDLDKNSGSKTKIVDLLEASVDDLKLSLQEKLADYLLGVTPADDLKRPAGMMDIVQDDPTTLPVAGSGVIGGIDASLAINSFWRNQTGNMAAAAFGTDQAGTGHTKLAQLVRDCTFGAMKPSVILAGEDAFEALRKSLVSQERFNDPRTDMLKQVGLDAMLFSNIPVVLEKRIDACREAAALNGSAFYALNFPTYRIDGMKKKWFKLGDFRSPTNQDSQVAHCITRLNTTVNARRTQGVLFNVV